MNVQYTPNIMCMFHTCLCYAVVQYTQTVCTSFIDAYSYLVWPNKVSMAMGSIMVVLWNQISYQIELC